MIAATTSCTPLSGARATGGVVTVPTVRVVTHGLAWPERGHGVVLVQMTQHRHTLVRVDMCRPRRDRQDVRR